MVKPKSREQKTDWLVNQDIEDIKRGLANNDVEFLNNVLRGEGWTGYNKLTDKELNEEFEDRYEE